LSWRPDLTDDARRTLLSRVSSEKRLLLSALCDGNVTLEQARWLVGEREIYIVYRAASLAGLAGRAVALPMLWRLATLQDSIAYPLDVHVREQALGSIFRIALAGSDPSAAKQPR
jgi:hypothetical protein